MSKQEERVIKKQRRHGKESGIWAFREAEGSRGRGAIEVHDGLGSKDAEGETRAKWGAASTLSIGVASRH